ncbi:MAG: PAS domain S-box-containing protein [Patiriisocius sp.]|jgi:PAS domain S-box-containing protein
MKYTKNGISLSLKFLYGTLIALSFAIIVIFYFDKSSDAQASYHMFLEKQVELISIQIDRGDLAQILDREFMFPDPNIVAMPEYNELTQKLNSDLEVLDIDACEIRIVRELSNGSLVNLISTEEVYPYGDGFKDRSGLMDNTLSSLTLFNAEINNDLSRSYIISPLTNSDNKNLAYLQLSAPTSPFLTEMNNALVLNISILLSIYILLGYFFIRSLKQNRNLISSRLEESQNISEQLADKNKDLHMLSLIAKTSKDLILITDNKGIILWINDSYKTKNNYSKTELGSFIGLSLNKVSRNKNIGNIIKNANSFKEIFTYETRSMDTNGLEFWAETMVNPVLIEKEVNTIIFIDQDITELMNLKSQLNLKEVSTKLNIKST